MNDIYTMFKYRGMTVNIYDDDAGQCFRYEIFDKDGKQVDSGSCGTYNLDYESEPKYLIDEMLDIIFRTEKPQGVLRFIDYEHTTIALQHYGDIIKIYTITPVHDLEDIVRIALNDLRDYCSTPEYLAAKEQRIAEAKLYLDEIMARNKRGNK